MSGLKRAITIIGGILLVLGGIVLLFLPGQGLLMIFAGIYLISPYHGKKLWEYAKQWKKTKLDRYLKRFRSK